MAQIALIWMFGLRSMHDERNPRGSWKIRPYVVGDRYCSFCGSLRLGAFLNIRNILDFTNH